MKIQFDLRNGAIAESNGYIVKCIPWKDGSGVYDMWNITVRKMHEDVELTDIELYKEDIGMIKMQKVMEWLGKNPAKTADEIGEYLKKQLACKKCSVYKITLAENGSYDKILEQSKGASKPELQYPGTRDDELD